MLEFIKSLFKKKYKEGREYYININKIKITPAFKRTKVRHEKMVSRFRYYLKNGVCKSPIILNKDMYLVDGYISYLIYKFKVGEVKVPVYFELDRKAK